MIQKIICHEHECLMFYFEDLGVKNPEYMRLYNLNGCLRCLEPNLKHNEQICFRCINGRPFEKLISLGIYATVPSYQKLFGNNSFHYIGHQILCMKPYKKDKKKHCSIEEKKKSGEITARLLAWLIREKEIDLTQYRTIIPVPSYFNENQVDYFGKPLSSLLNITYESKSLIRASPEEKIYGIAPNPPNLENQSVILLDDVYRHGKTKDACSNLLKKLGVINILVIVLGRTVNIEWWGKYDFG